MSMTTDKRKPDDYSSNHSEYHAAACVDPLEIGGRSLQSRLLLGTGRYPNPLALREAVRESGSEVLTFAIRRVRLDHVGDDAVLSQLDLASYICLPNTSGARTADEAVRIARLARSAGLGDWVKVEITTCAVTLLPDPLETLRATERLAAEGFVVCAYTSDDPMLCRRLEEAGASAVMPGGAPIGTGLGVLNPYNLGIIVEHAKVPVIVDAGLGCASDAAYAMELGADAVLMNTPVAKAGNPAMMARAMRLAVEAGRIGYLAGRVPAQQHAAASSEVADHWAYGAPAAAGAAGNSEPSL